MAYDGFFIKSHIGDINKKLINTKIDKIYMPNENEVLISFRDKAKSMLLFSISSQNPRFLLVKNKAQMPAKAPIFCMFMRKHLNGAILKNIRQYGYERIIFFDFEARNEIGDMGIKTICMEIMGRHSNFMLLDEEDNILDSLKRVSPYMSKRAIHGGIKYSLPPTTKTNPESVDFDFLSSLINPSDKMSIFKKLYMEVQGFSPTLSTSICIAAGLDRNKLYSTITEPEIDSLVSNIQKILDTNYVSKPIVYLSENNKCMEISSIELEQYSDKKFEIASDYSTAISRYFDENKNENKYSTKLNTIRKRIESLVAHRDKKVENLENDIENARNLDNYKLYGELILANLYSIKEKSSEVVLYNYYNDTMVTIPLNPLIDGNLNSQNYYKKYNKSKKTLDLAQKQLDITLEEKKYLETVHESLNNVENYEDIENIVQELENANFFTRKKSNKKIPKKKKQSFNPIKYMSSENVEIWVGKNNTQNDELTLKKSDKDFIWLHVKDMAGSHVVIRAKIEDISETSIYEAAEIAAFHSKAKNSSNVPVDFTEIKFVHKPKGAKAGMVIYTDNKTVYVNPKEKPVITRE